MATYVVSLVFDEVLEEGSEVTVCFENLTKDPYSSSPEPLMDGVWSLSFYQYDGRSGQARAVAIRDRGVCGCVWFPQG